MCIRDRAILEGNKVKNLQYISSVNIRMSHEILGCADKVLPYITKNRQVCHTLVISPPCCGKTTLIRDLIRQISDGNRYVKGCTVGVVDERSEIGGCYLGAVSYTHLDVYKRQMKGSFHDVINNVSIQIARQLDQEETQV